MNEQHAIGEEKVSITVVRKTRGDLVVSQHSSERWFVGEDEAAEALREVLEVFSRSVSDHTRRLAIANGENGPEGA